MTEQELNIKLNKWFEENWNHFVNEVGKNIAWGEMAEYKMDLCILMYEQFMNKPFKNKLQMYEDNKILNFLLFGASFQIRSGSSPFYNTFRKPRMHHVPEYFAENEDKNETFELDEIHLDDYYLCMKEGMKEENVGWYYNKLLDLKFIQQKSYNDISGTYGLCINTLKRDTKLAIEAVRKYCNYL